MLTSTSPALLKTMSMTFSPRCKRSSILIFLRAAPWFGCGPYEHCRSPRCFFCLPWFSVERSYGSRLTAPKLKGLRQANAVRCLSILERVYQGKRGLHPTGAAIFPLLEQGTHRAARRRTAAIFPNWADRCSFRDLKVPWREGQEALDNQLFKWLYPPLAKVIDLGLDMAIPV